jgi:PKD repeat protein
LLALAALGGAWPAAAAAEVPPAILQPLDGSHTLGSPAFSGISDGTANPVNLAIHEGATTAGATVTVLEAAVSEEGTWELSPPPLAEGTYTAAALEQNASAEELESLPVTFTVDSLPAITTQPADSAVVAGEPATFTAAASGTPGPSVLWEVSTDGGKNWSPDLVDPGATTGTLTITQAKALQNGYEYRALFENSRGSVASEPASLEVQSAPSVTAQPADAAVTAGEQATFTAAATGNPTPSVLWEVSIDGGKTWVADLLDSGATTDTLKIAHASPLQNGYEYRALFENSRGSVATEAASLEVLTAPTVTVQPASTAVEAGEQVKFKAAAEGRPAPSVRWELSTNGGASWGADLVDEGATTATLTIAHAAASQNGYEYRAVFENAVGTATSHPATLEVQTAPAVTVQPQSVAVHAGETAHLSAAASGRPQPQIQWQVSTNLGKSWSNDVSDGGTTSETLTVAAKASENGYEYRAVFSNVVGTAVSEPATLIVTEAEEAPSVAEQPADTTVTEGEGAVFTAHAEGSPSPTVQWQRSTDGGSSWSSDTTDKGNKTSSLLIASTTVSESGRKYRAVFTNASGSATTRAATLTVEPKPTAPVVTSQPHSTIVTAGDPASFSAAASGMPQPGVQWQVSTDEGHTWSADTTDSGNTSGTLAISAPAASQSGWEYRAMFNNGVGGPVASGAATLTVDTVPAVAEPPAEQARVVGEAAVFTVEPSGSPAPHLQWELSTNKGVSWTADKTDPGNTSPTLTVLKVTLADNGFQYRVHLSNRAGEATSGAAKLVVSEHPIAPVVTLQPLDATVLAGQPVSFTAAASGFPVPDVQWQVSTDGGASWSDDTTDHGATTPTLTIAAAEAGQNGWEYRALFSNGVGKPVETAAATLTVDTAPAVTVAPLDVTVHEGEQATFAAAASGRPAPGVSWQVSSDGGHTWSDDTTDGGAGTNVLTIAAAGATQSGYEYRAAFTNSAGEAVSAPATLTVTKPPPPPSPPGPPVASFTWFPAHPHTGEPVSLVSTSTDAFGAITAFAWDPTGSGSALPGASVLTTTFTTPGVHTVTLHVADSNGNSASASQPITVTKRVLALMQPFPVVRIAGSDTARGAKLTLLTVQAPAGATVTVGCRGGGCPPRTETRTVPAGSGAGGGALLSFRHFQRRLRAGAVLQIRVTRAGVIGKYTRFTIRRGHLPVRVDACIDPAVAAPIACPVG